MSERRGKKYGSVEYDADVLEPPFHHQPGTAEKVWTRFVGFGQNRGQVFVPLHKLCVVASRFYRGQEGAFDEPVLDLGRDLAEC